MKYRQSALGSRKNWLTNKFVRTTVRLFIAIFFSIFFSFYEWHLFPLNCTIDFQLILLDFAIHFAIFAIWLQTYEWTYGQNNGQTDRIMGRQTNEWMDMQYMCIDMQTTMIFQYILRFLDASSHLYKRVCPSVHRSVGP